MQNHATITADDDHPEDPKRISEIYMAFCKEGLIKDDNVKIPASRLPKVAGGASMIKIAVREVTEEEALLVHTKEHLEFLKGTEGELWFLVFLFGVGRGWGWHGDGKVWDGEW